MKSIKARTDGPVPLSTHIDEKGFKICRWNSEELKNYVQRFPDSYFLVKDGDGKFFKYQGTKSIHDQMVEEGFLVLDTHLREQNESHLDSASVHQSVSPTLNLRPL
jgi:hypothetical protein